MGKAKLTEEQIRQLMESWMNAGRGSLEQKLIEDLFLITETPLPQVRLNTKSTARFRCRPRFPTCAPGF